jgi:hypothetical protein
MKMSVFGTLVLSALAGLATGCGGGNGGGDIGGGGGTTPTQPTVTITTTTPTITIGQSLTLAIGSANATGGCTATVTPTTGNLSGTVTCNGSVTVTPTATGTFTFTVTANGASGTTPASQSVVVTVNPVPVVVTSTSLTCTPLVLAPGQTSQCNAVVSGTGGTISQQVTYAVTNGTASATGLITPTQITSGTETVLVVATSVQDTTKSSAPVSITMTVPVLQPTAAFTSQPPTIVAGQSATLTYSCTNVSGANGCAINGTSVPSGINQTYTVSPTTTTTYVLTATGPSGTTPESSSVVVTVIPVTVTSITASALPLSIQLGQTAQCSAVVNGTGNPPQAVTWSSTGGTITQAGVFTSTSVGNGSCTANSTLAGYTTVSGSATITVTAPPPTVTSVAPSCPSPITTAQTSQCTVTVSGTGGTISQQVTWSASAGTITPSGVFSSTATGTFTITATSVQDSTKSSSITVTVTAPPAISVQCIPSAITTAGSSQCTATYQNLSSGVNWTVLGGGTVSAAGLYTPPAIVSGSITATITATSTQAGYTTVSGAATVTVTAAKPVITGVNITGGIYADAEAGFIGNIQLTGSGFQNTDTAVSNPIGLLYGAQFVSSGQINVTLAYDTPHTSPGWDTITVTSPDGTTSSSITIPFLGNQNLLSVSPMSGELYFLDEGNKILRQYKADGTVDVTTNQGITDSSVATDDKTGYVVLNQRSAGNNTFDVVGIETLGNGSPGVAVAARNGYGCITQVQTQAPIVNNLSCVNLTISPSSNPSLNSLSIGSQPWSLAMGLFGTETDAFVFSRDGTPTLWKVNVSGGLASTNSQAIPGITPVATLQASNVLAGGWYVAVFDSGPAAGTVAVLSTADKLLTFLNTSTMAITKQVTLSGIPFRIAADMTHGNLIVAYADQVDVLTTFSAVNPSTGAVTPLTSTSSLLAVGFAVKADGTSIYACQRAICEVHPNQ